MPVMGAKQHRGCACKADLGIGLHISYNDALEGTTGGTQGVEVDLSMPGGMKGTMSKILTVPDKLRMKWLSHNLVEASIDLQKYALFTAHIQLLSVSACSQRGGGLLPSPTCSPKAQQGRRMVRHQHSLASDP